VRYMERGGFQSQPLMRLTLGLTLAFLSGLWVTNLAMAATRMGLTPASIRGYYLGSEAEFRGPRTLGSMLEVTHAHLPMMGLVLLLVTHLLIFAPWSERRRQGLILTVFLSALGNEGAGWLVRFVNPGLAWVKLASFLVFQLAFGAVLAGLGWMLINPSRRKP